MIGSVLVERSTRHLRLTDAGLLFRPYAERIVADVGEASIALESYGGVPRGRLRINAPFTFAVDLQALMLPAFMARYPEVNVIIDVENRGIDMPGEAADLVIRIRTLPDTGLIARKPAPVEMWVCASPGDVTACSTPATIADLADHHLIAGFDRVMNWTFQLADGSTEQIEVQPTTVIPEPAALQIVLARGAGIGRLPGFLAQQAVADGTLVRLFADARSDVIDVHALYLTFIAQLSRSPLGMNQWRLQWLTFADTVDLPLVDPYLLDFRAQRGVASLTHRGFSGVSPCCQTGVVSRWGNRHHSADRHDPMHHAMIVNKTDHGLNGRASSACAKYEDAIRRISFACLNSQFSRSRTLIRSRSALVTPSRNPESNSPCRTQMRKVSAVHPIFGAMATTAAVSAIARKIWLYPGDVGGLSSAGET